MKFEGYYNNIPMYSDPNCPPNMVYFFNENDIEMNYPKRKDGKLDMRYRVNKIKVMLERSI